MVMTVTDMEMDRTRRRVALAVCSTSLLLVGLDVTIVNVALPEMRRALGAGLSDLQWIVDVYTLVFAGLLLLAGSVADRLGRRRVFRAGLATFSLASVLCAAAPTLELLVAFRAVQAVGAAMLGPATMSIVRTVFADPAERARAIGVYASMFGVSLALGPVLGGVLVSAFSWRAVFLVTVPVGLVAFALAARLLPESRAPHPRRVDPVGQVLVIAVLAALVGGAIEGGRAGLTAPGVVFLLGAALAGLPALLRYELRRRDPLLEPRFFASVPFAGAGAIALCLSVALGGFLFVNTLYLQGARGLSPAHAGLYLLPVAAMSILVSPVSGRLTGAFGARVPMTAGGIVLLAGGVLLTRLTPDTPVAYLLLSYATFGAGFALVSPPIASTAVSGMPAAQAGVAAAVATTLRQTGIALGVAVLGAVAAGDARAAWWIVAALGLVIAALGLVTTSAWARATAARTAERLA
jgi:EmrB/QacA subfamily drug resistance transporter